MTFSQALEVLKRGGKVRGSSIWSGVIALRDGKIVKLDHAGKVECELTTVFWHEILFDNWTDVTP